MNRTSLFSLVVALAFFIFALGGYVVWYYQVTEQRAKAATLEGEVIEAEQTDARAESAAETLEAFTDRARELRSYFIREQDIVPFLERLEETASMLGATLTIVSVSIESSTEHSYLLVNFSATGTFESIMKTLGVIEHGPYDSTVRSTTLSASPVAPDGTYQDRWTIVGTLAIGTPLIDTNAP